MTSLGRKRKREEDFIYVNLNQWGAYDEVTVAKLDFTKTVPIVESPDNYQLAVTSFALKSALIPTFIKPQIGFTNLFRVAIMAGDLGKLVQTNPAHPIQKYNYPLNDGAQIVEVWPNEDKNWYLQNPQKEIGTIRDAIYSYEKIFADINEAIFHSAFALSLFTTTYPNNVPAVAPSIAGIDMPWFSSESAITHLNFTSYYVPQLFDYQNTDPSGNDSAVALFLCVSKALARNLTFPFFGLEAFNIQPGEDFTGFDNEFQQGKDSDLVFIDISSIWSSSLCSEITTYSRYLQRSIYDLPGNLTAYAPAKVTYLTAVEVESALHLWNAPTKLFFRSNLPIFTAEQSGQSAVKDNILQDYELTGLISHNASSTNVVFANPIFFSINQGSNLSSVSVSAFWIDFYGNSRPVYLTGNDSFSMKLQFQKIVDTKKEDEDLNQKVKIQRML